MYRITTRIAVVMSVLLLYSLPNAAGVTVNGFLFILGSKTLNGETKSPNNLDVLLGLGDVNLSAKTDKFEGFMEAYLWPAGFGFTYVESALLDSATNTIITKTADAPNVTVVNAWGRFTTKYLQMQIGRAMLKYSNGFFFGDYLHRGSGPIVDYSGSIQNCLSFQNTTGIFTTSVLFGAGDINLNKGYLTFREVIKPTEASEVALGFQGNVFDPIHDENADIVSNLSLSARLDYSKGQSAFAELGIRGIGAPGEDARRFPFMLGFSVPTSNLLTKLSFEIEYDEKRESVDKMNSFSFGASAMKMFNDHFIAILSFNNGSSEKTEVVGANLEMVVLF